MKPFARTVRTLGLAWLALVVLLLLSLGSAYLDLGSGNLWLGLGIAAVKAAVVLWLFMKIGETKGMVKVAAFAGLFILALLAGLSSTDYRTRIPDPATWTSPLQIAPFIQKGR
ncbi:MAG: Caa(3)-type oxidase subunit [Rhizobacter sp.]|nr:Caa(3)-type oxidase subunit [Rhizobacter sp.]